MKRGATEHDAAFLHIQDDGNKSGETLKSERERGGIKFVGS